MGAQLRQRWHDSLLVVAHARAPRAQDAALQLTRRRSPAAQALACFASAAAHLNAAGAHQLDGLLPRTSQTPPNEFGIEPLPSGGHGERQPPGS